jgi:biotin synthase
MRIGDIGQRRRSYGSNMENETSISKERLLELLSCTGTQQRELHHRAAALRDSNVGKKVFFRGLIEFSNICMNDCGYCGIRRSNQKINRYTMISDDILEAVDYCWRQGYGSIVLQSGERQDGEFVDSMVETVRKIRETFPDIGITLCIGEQSKATYKELFDAGADRYLLRIETSNEAHYKRLHPPSMSFARRVRCLRDLRDIGFHVGTGVMIGSPYQTVEHLADDLLFFRQMDVDMVGMGPCIPHSDAPLRPDLDRRTILDLSLNMIAALRLLMPDINIAATTALQAAHPSGRELGLLAGANVIMPLVTPPEHRKDYVLYDDKPCRDESADDCLRCVVKRVISAGMVPGFNERGDSTHYLRRTHHVRAR